MKKILFAFLVLVMAVLSSLTAFAIDGDGTEETPFLITNQAELTLVTDFPSSHFKLENDIELEGTWVPLCKETTTGYFSGVFDGAGYTISNLLTDGSEGGLFKYNKGTIKNLNIIISDEGITGNAGVSRTNAGIILNCTVKGNISSSSQYAGGICAYNSGDISQCRFEGNIINTYSVGSYYAYTGGICGYNDETVRNCAIDAEIAGMDYVGGVCGYNYSPGIIENCAAFGNITGTYHTGGVCGHNKKDITHCYFIGTIASTGSYSYSGGIAGYNDYVSNDTTNRGKITNCYAAPVFEGTNNYGIAYKYGSAKITKSYYDKTVSGLTSTSYGTPKSTAAMKMKQTFSTDWDFDTVWGIDKNINDGYPYLLWEYPDAVAENKPYTVSNVKIKDASGNELLEFPNDSFYFEIDVVKNDNSKDVDSLIIAVYDENDVMIDVKYMSGVYYQNQEITFGTMVNKTDKKIGNVKAFVWNSLSGLIPLSNSLGIK